MYKLGVVGSGMIANFHAQAVQNIQGIKLVNVLGRNEQQVQEFCQSYGCDGYLEQKDFLSSDIDIVSIATPSGLHLEGVKAAAEAGKHVLCEKPLEVTTEKIDEMIRICEHNGVELGSILPRRFTKATEFFKEAVRDRKFGKITNASAYIKWYRTQEYYDSGQWRGTWKLDGGGALMNQSIHTVDSLLHIMGEKVVSVRAFSGCLIHENIEVEDSLVAIIRFESGAMGTIEASTACFSNTGHPAEVQICGEKGSVFMQDDKFSVWDFQDDDAKNAEILEQYGVGGNSVGVGAADPKAIDCGNHQRNFENFLNHLDNIKSEKPGKIDYVGGVEGRKSVKLIEAIYRSAKNNGCEVNI